jgi:hypothetical protein
MRNLCTTSIHADLNTLIFRRWTMETDFNLVQIDMNDFLTIRTHFCYLPIEIDRISTTRTTGYNNTDDLGFLLHGQLSFPECDGTKDMVEVWHHKYKQIFLKNNPLNH